MMPEEICAMIRHMSMNSSFLQFTLIVEHVFTKYGQKKVRKRITKKEKNFKDATKKHPPPTFMR